MEILVKFGLLRATRLLGLKIAGGLEEGLPRVDALAVGLDALLRIISAAISEVKAHKSQTKTSHSDGQSI